MSSTRRERQREATREEIKSIARKQMAAQGTAALSLRGIATEMGVTATALYRYYGSRDDLITDLILDAFNAHADAMQAADATQPADDFSSRLLAVLSAYREWAIAHPTDFQLIYGNPIPGYTAPAELTVAAARRSMEVVGRILGEAIATGKWTTTEHELPETVAHHLKSINDFGIPDIVLYVSMVGWSRIHGMVMLEIFDHSPPLVGDPTAFYRQEISALVRSFGL